VTPPGSRGGVSPSSLSIRRLAPMASFLEATMGLKCEIEEIGHRCRLSAPVALAIRASSFSSSALAALRSGRFSSMTMRDDGRT
jgi:hypothetical protein